MFENILGWFFAGISIITFLYFIFDFFIKEVKEYWNDIKNKNFNYFLETLKTPFVKFFITIASTIGIVVLVYFFVKVYDVLIPYYSLVKFVLYPIVISLILWISYFILNALHEILKESEKKLEKEEKESYKLYLTKLEKLIFFRKRIFLSIILLSVSFLFIIINQEYASLFFLFLFTIYFGEIGANKKAGYWVTLILSFIFLTIAGIYFNIFSFILID